jgi:hypothetical protein
VWPVTVADRWRCGGRAETGWWACCCCEGGRTGGWFGGSGIRRDNIYYLCVKFRGKGQVERRMRDARLTEVRSLPGSPNDDRQEMSSLPRGRIVPGACCTGMAGGLISLRAYIYCLVSCGCIKAVDPENKLPLLSGSKLASWTSQPGAGSKAMCSNHMGSDVRFCMWTSRKTFVRSFIDSNADGERGTWTLVLTDSGLVTYKKSTLVRRQQWRLDI